MRSIFPENRLDLRLKIFITFFLMLFILEVFVKDCSGMHYFFFFERKLRVYRSWNQHTISIGYINIQRFSQIIFKIRTIL